MAVACSYRLDLARTHTVAGIEGLAPWWTYVLKNVDSLDEGRGLVSGSLYAPGQSIASWIVLAVLDGRDDPAVLRIVFGFLDGVCVVFLVLAGKELLSWGAGLVAGLLYALWPAGASASVNLLHDHSPQPFFLFAGLWLVLCALRLERPALLFAGACLLGLPALFRADGSVVGAALALGVAAVVWNARRAPGRALAWGALAFAGVLAPSLPWDAWTFSRTGRLQHIAMGDAGAAVFMRFGHASGFAGARYNDSEVAFLGGSSEPFGPDWTDARRQRIPGDFGRTLFWADPVRYARLVRSEMRSVATERAGRAAWWAPDSRNSEASRATEPSGRLEAWLARLGRSRLLSSPVDTPWIYLLGVLGTVSGLIARRPTVVVPAVVGLFWMAALTVLLPNARYLLMPSCFLFPLMGVLFASVARVFVQGVGSLRRAGAEGKTR
ncbi:MAG TPA: glycosyltransferase family 39 protein [Thermoanaerobaculia bacterium]|nr:glycosyltransferase family 39 protein [Thermoanaerobaculia bacterium]